MTSLTQSAAVGSGFSAEKKKHFQKFGRERQNPAMSRVAEWLKSAGLGQFVSNFNVIDEEQFLSLQVRRTAPLRTQVLVSEVQHIDAR